MEFDHVTGNKVATICEMVSLAMPLDTIEEEIKKCEVRCCNCHRIKSSTEGDYNKYVIKEGVDIGWKTRELFDNTSSFKDKGLIPSETLKLIDEELAHITKPTKAISYRQGNFKRVKKKPVDLKNFIIEWHLSDSIREVARRTSYSFEKCREQGILLDLSFKHFINSRTPDIRLGEEMASSKIPKEQLFRIWDPQKSYRQMAREMGLSESSGPIIKRAAKRLGLIN